MSDDDKSLADLHEDLRAFSQLRESLGWRRLKEIAEVQLQTRVRDSVYAPPKGLMDLITRTYTNGECSGMLILLGLPELMIDSLKMDIEQRNRLEEND